MGTAGQAALIVGGEGISEWKVWNGRGCVMTALQDTRVLISGACECYLTGQRELGRCQVKDPEMEEIILHYWVDLI